MLSRYECKYFLSDAKAEAIRRFIAPLVKPDPHAANLPDHTYSISSLYLDTNDLALYKMTDRGQKNRFKLRIRVYENDTEGPAFFEIKRRVNDIVVKERAALPPEDARSWIEACENGTLTTSSFSTDPLTHSFTSLACRLGVRGAYWVAYERQAYEAKDTRSLRVTFDRALRYAKPLVDHAALAAQPTRPAHRWTTLGLHWHAIEGPGPILEVKFNNHPPPWFRTLVDKFGLQKQSIPKYALSVDHALAERGRPTLEFRW